MIVAHIIMAKSKTDEFLSLLNKLKAVQTIEEVNATTGNLSIGDLIKRQMQNRPDRLMRIDVLFRSKEDFFFTKLKFPDVVLDLER